MTNRSFCTHECIESGQLITSVTQRINKPAIGKCELKRVFCFDRKSLWYAVLIVGWLALLNECLAIQKMLIWDHRKNGYLQLLNKSDRGLSFIFGSCVVFLAFSHIRSRPLGHNRARPDVRNNVLGKAVYRRTRTLSVQIKLTHSHFRTLLGLFVLTAWLSGGFRRIINSPSPSVCSVHLHGLPFNYRHMGPAREPRRRWTHFEDIT